MIENPGGNAKFRGLTLRAVARALRWPADAIERVLAGEDPADWDEPTSVAADPSLHPTGGLPADVSRPADVAIAALNDTAGQLTPEQREQLLALARTMLEQRRAAERGP